MGLGTAVWSLGNPLHTETREALASALCVAGVRPEGQASPGLRGRKVRAAGQRGAGPGPGWGRGLLPGRRGACAYLYKSLLTSQAAWEDLAGEGLIDTRPSPSTCCPVPRKAQIPPPGREFSPQRGRLYCDNGNRLLSAYYGLQAVLHVLHLRLRDYI